MQDYSVEKINFTFLIKFLIIYFKFLVDDHLIKQKDDHFTSFTVHHLGRLLIIAEVTL